MLVFENFFTSYYKKSQYRLCMYDVKALSDVNEKVGQWVDGSVIIQSKLTKNYIPL